MSNLQQIIEAAFEKRAEITPKTVDAQTRAAIEEVIEGLDSGKYRVAEKIDGEWVTHQWLKKAVLLSFRINDNQIIDGAETKYYDKVALKFADYTEERFAQEGFRVVPSATVRKGAYISKNCVLMPSYVNIGAYVGEGTMVDTWATVGSCAQIGKNVHLSGGVGIGGVLEPLQANPTIIGDNCFIGARSEVVEGVIVEDGCVISMGVFIGQSTKIYDRETGEVLPDGEQGELVFTSITKEAFPLLRYRTRDICVLSHEKCSCGRTHVKMTKPRGRSDDMLIIRGVNVFPSQIETVLLNNGYPANYQIIVDRVKSTDTLDVQVEMTPEMFTDNLGEIERRQKELVDGLRSMLGLAAKVTLVAPKSIVRSEGKAVRVIDNRKI